MFYICSIYRFCPFIPLSCQKEPKEKFPGILIVSESRTMIRYKLFNVKNVSRNALLGIVYSTVLHDGQKINDS